MPRSTWPGTATTIPASSAFYLAREGGTNYAYTQFEASTRAAPSPFRRARFKTPFDVTLTVRSADVAVANTLPLSEEQAGLGMKRIHLRRDQTAAHLSDRLGGRAVRCSGRPHASAEFHPQSADPRRGGIAPKGHPGEFAYALRIGAELLLLEENYFGIAYPYEKLDQVAVPDYAYGAMENAGEIHYREDLLLFKEGRSAEESRIDVAQTMAHEQAHQWFGDLVTMRWWDEAWLNGRSPPGWRIESSPSGILR